MKIYTYKVKVGETFYKIQFLNENIEKILDYYKIPYEKVEENK